jgi:hypothetical protein
MNEEIEILIRIGLIDELTLLWGGRDYFEKNQIINIYIILFCFGFLDLCPLCD